MILRAPDREHQYTFIQIKIQRKFVYACISQLHLLFDIFRSYHAMKFVRGLHQHQINVFMKGIDIWRASVQFTVQLLENINLSLFKAKFKANVSMNEFHSYTCYLISIDPSAP